VFLLKKETKFTLEFHFVDQVWSWSDQMIGRAAGQASSRPRAGGTLNGYLKAQRGGGEGVSGVRQGVSSLPSWATSTWMTSVGNKGKKLWSFTVVIPSALVDMTGCAEAMNLPSWNRALNFFLIKFNDIGSLLYGKKMGSSPIFQFNTLYTSSDFSPLFL
jgi:hypothetical protein